MIHRAIGSVPANHDGAATARRAAAGTVGAGERREITVRVNLGNDCVTNAGHRAVGHAEIPVGGEVRQRAVGIDEDQFGVAPAVLAALEERG